MRRQIVIENTDGQVILSIDFQDEGEEEIILPLKLQPTVGQEIGCIRIKKGQELDLEAS